MEKPQKPSTRIEKLPPKLPQTQKITAGFYSGPIPPAKEMEHYQQIDSSFPARIMKMAEKEQEHKIKMDEKVIPENQKIFKRGQLFALIISFLIILLAFYLVYEKYPWTAVVVIISFFISLANNFILKKKIKKNN